MSTNPYRATVFLYKWKENAPDYARLTPEGNYVIDNLSDFISANFDLVNTIENSDSVALENFYKFPELQMKLKFPLPATPMGVINDSSAGQNYNRYAYAMIRARLDTDSDSSIRSAFYYFVTSSKRISNRTLELSLQMDTLNTFAPGLGIKSSSGTYIESINFDEDTLVIREHRDRVAASVNSSGNITAPYRIIDDSDEGIATPTFPIKRITYEEKDTALQSAGKCYLVYKARSNLSPDNLENALGVYIAYENGFPITPAKSASNTIVKMGAMATAGVERQVLFLWKWQNPNLKSISWWGDNLSTSERKQLQPAVTIDESLYSQCDGVAVSIGGWGASLDRYMQVDYLLDNGTSFGILASAKTGTPDLSAISTMYAYLDDCNYYCPAFTGGVSTSTAFYQYVMGFNTLSSFPKGNGSGGVKGGSMAQVNRYDPRNVKIIALPYSPIELSLNEDGTAYLPPDGWNLDTSNGLVSPAAPDTKMEREIASIEDIVTGIFGVPDYPKQVSQDNATILRKDEFESKQYNSAFHEFKWYYDSSSWSFMAEKAKVTTGQPFAQPCPITYKQSSSISSRLAFAFGPSDPPYKYSGDFGTIPGGTLKYNPPLDYPNVMVCSRSLELPIFTSDYLNYIRNGYNYDLKANEYAKISDYVGASLNFLGRGAETAMGFGTRANTVGTRIYGYSGWAAHNATRTANDFIQAALSSAERDNAMAKTLQGKAMSAINVDGSDDLDIFEWYSGNKLHFLEGEPLPMTKAYILDLFHYFGYATNERKAPTIHTRANFNYLQCNPRFKEEQALGVEIANDLKSRFQSGVTYLWENNGSWDFEGIYANLEIWTMTGNI